MRVKKKKLGADENNKTVILLIKGLLQCLSGKESACNAGDTGDTGQEDPLEEEMATHSSNLAWKTPRTEELGWPQSRGLKRVGHGQLSTHTHTH